MANADIIIIGLKRRLYNGWILNWMRKKFKRCKPGDTNALISPKTTTHKQELDIVHVTTGYKWNMYFKNRVPSQCNIG